MGFTHQPGIQTGASALCTFPSLSKHHHPTTIAILTKELVTKNFVLVQRVRKEGVREGPRWVGDPGKVRP